MSHGLPMRPTILLTVLVPALGLLILLAFLRPAQDAATAGGSSQSVGSERASLLAKEHQGQVPTDSRRGDSLRQRQPVSGLSTRPTLSPPNRPPDEEAQDRSNDLVLSRVAELGELAMADDATSLGTILSELDNPEPRIRDAALQAAIQFGSREVIPRLREVAARTDDPQAKRALDQAIEFLTLPSLTEVIEERKHAASRQSPGG
jgi:hypothetical protein